MSENTSPHSHAGNHEPDVVDARAIWRSAAALIAVIVVAGILMQALMMYFSGRSELSPLAAPSAPSTPAQANAPLLNPNQRAALLEFRAAERAYLNEYQWIDQDAGLARIPVARAVEILSKSGLPPAIGKTTATGEARN